MTEWFIFCTKIPILISKQCLRYIVYHFLIQIQDNSYLNVVLKKTMVHGIYICDARVLFFYQITNTTKMIKR